MDDRSKYIMYIIIIIISIVIIYFYSIYSLNQPINVAMDNLSNDQVDEVISIALNSTSFPQTPDNTNYTVGDVIKLPDHYKGIPVLEDWGKNYPFVQVDWRYKNGSDYGAANIYVDLTQHKVVNVKKTF